ncbi:gas vesicle protein GvpG [Marinococcus halophilus]|uniref:Gas vesicle protein GvpG n=1 Tax=Marinococcus halophilus TaxID=1371 RepID=A0A510Y5D0_MARHA|nr:gas vesicle protein GvpG [Marinococcus halophilus]OZT80470.1 gas vesicle protein GvpG [Marinococcus halophilus]GEK58542.1 hypothetical protein MHA01_14470 [Marinococcus halophilus]
MIHKLFTWPLDTVVWAGKKVKEEADKEYFDVRQIQKKLANLQIMYEMEEISEDAFTEQEEELLQRYRRAKQIEQEELREELEEKD